MLPHRKVPMPHKRAVPRVITDPVFFAVDRFRSAEENLTMARLGWQNRIFTKAGQSAIRAMEDIIKSLTYAIGLPVFGNHILDLPFAELMKHPECQTSVNQLAALADTIQLVTEKRKQLSPGYSLFGERRTILEPEVYDESFALFAIDAAERWREFIIRWSKEWIVRTRINADLQLLMESAPPYKRLGLIDGKAGAMDLRNHVLQRNIDSICFRYYLPQSGQLIAHQISYVFYSPPEAINDQSAVSILPEFTANTNRALGFEVLINPRPSLAPPSQRQSNRLAIHQPSQQSIHRELNGPTYTGPAVQARTKILKIDQTKIYSQKPEVDWLT